MSQYIALAAVDCKHTTVSLRISVVLQHIVIGTPAVWSLLLARLLYIVALLCIEFCVLATASATGSYAKNTRLFAKIVETSTGPPEIMTSAWDLLSLYSVTQPIAMVKSHNTVLCVLHCWHTSMDNIVVLKAQHRAIRVCAS